MYYVIERSTRKVVAVTTSLSAARAARRLFGGCEIETKDSVIFD